MLPNEAVDVLLTGSRLDVMRVIDETNVNCACGLYDESPLVRFARNTSIFGTEWTSTIDYLLDLGADINYADELGENAIQSVRCDNVVRVSYLIKKGCDPNHVDGSGRTCMSRALSDHHLDVGWLLYKHGCRSANSGHISSLLPYLKCECAAYTIIGIRKFRTSILNINDKHVIHTITKKIMETKTDDAWKEELPIEFVNAFRAF
jgi:ankyrin repeat protein